jgi:hypothetical protein
VADQPQDSLLREIDEELRQEQYTKLWKKYGSYVLAVATVIVVSVAGYQGWRAYDLDSRTTQGEQFAAAQRLAGADKADEARQAFAELAADAGSGYALLARLQEAALRIQLGDGEGAGLTYNELATDDGVDSTYRDLAIVVGVLNDMNTAGPDDLQRRLAPLTADDNPWHHLALELTALSMQRGGNTDEARKAFARLAEDATAPQGVRARAGEVLAALGK